jgi:hypothetical protein
MPRGDKSKYTDKQKRKAEHIEESYERRGDTGRRGRAPCVGHREQGVRRREQVRQRARGAGHERFQPQGGKDRRRGLGGAKQGRAVGVREEGRRDAEAQRAGPVNYFPGGLRANTSSKSL